MKIIVAIIGFTIASLSCIAQTSSTNRVDDSRFVICLDGQPVCKIVGLAPTNSAVRQYQGTVELEARRLQKYFYLLSGCEIPIQHLDEIPTDTRIAYTVHMTIYAPQVGRGSAGIRLYRHVEPYTTPLLSVDDSEIARGLLRQRDGATKEIEFPRPFLKQAIDAFGEKYFGVPVSAIDDTNFNWSAHHTNTLAISYADFQPIQFPPPNPKAGTQGK